MQCSETLNYNRQQCTRQATVAILGNGSVRTYHCAQHAAMRLHIPRSELKNDSRVVVSRAQ